MKIAFVGKGGSGKTTLSALFARHLGAQALPVLAIDADINQHLGEALGADPETVGRVPRLGDSLVEIKEFLRGTNPRITSVDAMIKTTPPGTGSRLLRPMGDDLIHKKFAVPIGYGVRLMVAGELDEETLGTACYHSKTGSVELILGHMIDAPDEYVVVDMTAGSDAFASALCARFDITFFVVEPTRKSVGVFRQYRNYAANFGVEVKAIGNKVSTNAQQDFLRDQLGDDLLVCFGMSAYVQSLEIGTPLPFDQLEDDIVKSLKIVHRLAASTPQDWGKFWRLSCQFHARNAYSWGNKATGQDLTEQIDPGFKMSPELLAV